MLGGGRFSVLKNLYSFLFKGGIMKKLVTGLAVLAVLGFFTSCDNMGGISKPDTSDGNNTEQTDGKSDSGKDDSGRGDGTSGGDSSSGGGGTETPGADSGSSSGDTAEIADILTIEDNGNGVTFKLGDTDENAHDFIYYVKYSDDDTLWHRLNYSAKKADFDYKYLKKGSDYKFYVEFGTDDVWCNTNEVSFTAKSGAGELRIKDNGKFTFSYNPETFMFALNQKAEFEDDTALNGNGCQVLFTFYEEPEPYAFKWLFEAPSADGKTYSLLDRISDFSGKEITVQVTLGLSDGSRWHISAEPDEKGLGNNDFRFKVPELQNRLTAVPCDEGIKVVFALKENETVTSETWGCIKEKNTGLEFPLGTGGANSEDGQTLNSKKCLAVLFPFTRENETYEFSFFGEVNGTYVSGTEDGYKVSATATKTTELGTWFETNREMFKDYEVSVDLDDEKYESFIVKNSTLTYENLKVFKEALPGNVQSLMSEESVWFVKAEEGADGNLLENSSEWKGFGVTPLVSINIENGARVLISEEDFSSAGLIDNAGQSTPPTINDIDVDENFTHYKGGWSYIFYVDGSGSWSTATKYSALKQAAM